MKDKLLKFLRENTEVTDEEIKAAEAEATDEQIVEARADFEKEQKLEKAAAKVAEMAAERATEKVLEKLAEIEPVLRKNLAGLDAEKKTITLIKEKLGVKSLKTEVSESSIKATVKWFRAYKKSFDEQDPAILQKAVDEISAQHLAAHSVACIMSAHGCVSR